MSKSFVKSADTSTPIVNSRAEIERILRRYGADGLAVAQNYAAGTVLVSFIVPDSLAPGAQKVPISLPVDVLRVFNALYPTDSRGRRRVWTIEEARGKTNERAWAQAERVAWRNLVLWIDAALSASAAGLQTITEAFFAHTVVEGRRVSDIVAAGDAPALQQRLLGSGS